MSGLSTTDPEIFEAIQNETRRQAFTLEMIASENFVKEEILEAQGSVLTNKYAEGYPGRRYYGGCEHVDVAERLAIGRAKELFGAEHANVQPHSGTQANTAVYVSQIQPGDAILGMDLSHGGHLSHGHPLNISGRLYKVSAYGVNRDSERVEPDEVRKIAKETKPRIIVAGWSAYPRILDFASFRDIADEVGAILMTDMAHFAGLVAGGVHPSPVRFARVATEGRVYGIDIESNLVDYLNARAAREKLPNLKRAVDVLGPIRQRRGTGPAHGYQKTSAKILDLLRPDSPPAPRRIHLVPSRPLAPPPVKTIHRSARSGAVGARLAAPALAHRSARGMLLSSASPLIGAPRSKRD